MKKTSRERVVFLLVLSMAFQGTIGHVKLRYAYGDDGPSWPIRNAPSASSDGAFSTSGPCGGNDAWGANGFANIANGASVSLYISYNGGHQSDANLFHVAFHCDEDGSTLTQDAFRNEAHKVSSCATVPATDSRVNPPYNMVCDLPLAQGDNQFCTISVVEQRNWGGCYDVKVTPVDAESVDTTSKLSTSYLAFQSVNTAPPETTCCNFTSATLEVGSLSDGKVSVKAGGTTDCANFTTWEQEFELSEDEFEILNSDQTGTRFVNSDVAVNSETFGFTLVNSVLTSSNQRGGGVSPIMCDHVFKAFDSEECSNGECLESFFGLGDPCDADGGALAGAIVALVVVLALAGALAYAKDIATTIGEHLAHSLKHAALRFVCGFLALLAFAAYADNDDDDLQGDCSSPSAFIISMGVLVWLYSWLLTIVVSIDAFRPSCVQDSSCWASFSSVVGRVAGAMDGVLGFLTMIAICAAAFNHPSTDKAQGGIAALFFAFVLLVLTTVVQFTTDVNIFSSSKGKASSSGKGFRRSSADGDFAA